ncbi:EspA/EspE family type VII secretion system effector [Mycobacterium marinum]|uniref:EspA/EspE family type VII secretion system effector n=1 Tax=Mycobacterium marinum TaxID=1781 RepID=UPI00307A5C57
MRRGTIICLLTGGYFGFLLHLFGGDGSPDHGDRLVTSGSMFDDLGAQIAALVRDGGWQGVAAQHYGALTLAQSQRATLMADLDRLAAERASTQAEAVTTLRTELVALLAVDGALFLLCLGLETKGKQLASHYIALVGIEFLFVLTLAFLLASLVTASRNASGADAALDRHGGGPTDKPGHDPRLTQDEFARCGPAPDRLDIGVRCRSQRADATYP